ncbi:MAG TPA: efflux RND transporter periplasmic adaptor subunit [Opitutaceae bacterium]|nr:efflux RND transporter periplasmic adaptor subunit [Opitutaceae bacterium]
MNTRPTVLLLAALALLLLAPAAWAAKQLYTCGMHPQIIRDQPGDCPICGMKLQPILGDAAGAAGTTIQIDAATVQRMNLKTALVRTGPARREIRTVGSVAYNEEGFRDITTKYEGWLEKLHVNATWTAVKAGDPLFEIYSPDLYGAALNYLAARKAERDERGPLSRAAEMRLRLLDIPAEEIAALERGGEAPRTRVFPAPADGVVIEKMGVAGQMMKPGERIYRLADLSSVWVIAQIYESDLPFVHEGQTVTVRTSYGARREFPGTIARLLPQVDEQTRAVAARIVVPNPDGFLRPGMYTDVHLAAQVNDAAVLVPEIAVLRSGERNTVFIAKDSGTFDAREVRLGVRSEGGDYEVLAGLAAGERVVTSGQFMLDSESQLREAIQKMIKGDAASGVALPGGHAGHGAFPSATPKPAELVAPAEPSPAHQEHVHGDTPTPVGAPTFYTCPMESHADVVTDHPGECPKCGMDLVPTSEVQHGKRSEELWRKQHPAGAHQHGG